MTDIEDRKRADTAIGTSERNFKLIIDTIPALAWSARPDGSAEFLNQRYLDFIGLSADQAVDWNWTSAVHPDDLAGLAATWERILASGAPGEAEARLRRHDGQYRWFLFRANPLRDEMGNVKWYAVNTDIEDRKRAEAELRRSYGSFAEAQRLSKTGSFTADITVDEHVWSDELYRICEFDPGTKITANWAREIIHPEDLPSFDAGFARSLGGADFDLTFRIVTRSGKVKHLHSIAHMVDRVEGRPLFIGAIQDVTDARAYEQERQRANALAELDRAKTAFFSNVSHELRTPLQLMLGPLEEALPEASERLGPERHQQLLTVRRNALRLLKLVNTLLDFSRLEAGRVQAAFQPTDLASLTSDIASMFRSAMDRAGLQFSIACEPVGKPVFVDRGMWEKVVSNLLSNALKFTFEGEVALSLRLANGAVELQVRDTGVGIPDDQREKVFERFHRIEQVSARTHEGTGIGLSLVQELVKLHGGSVGVTSSVGFGSTFTVTIPLREEHSPAESLHAEQSFASSETRPDAYVEEALRWVPDASRAADVATDVVPAGKRELIVLADDNSDMRQYLTRLLGDRYEVHAVADGQQALEAVRGLRPALVLADVMMPRLDGLALLRAIRDDEALRSTPVILVSARAGEESRVEGLQADADDYLVKPFTSPELLARVAAHIKMAHLRRVTAERDERLRDLGERERESRLIVDSIPGLIATFTPAGELEFVNRPSLDYFGRTFEELQGWAAGGMTHPEDLPRALERFRQSIASGDPFEFEVRARRYDDAYRWFQARGCPLRDSNGHIVRWYYLLIDIDDRKRAEEALRESERRSRLLVETIPALVWAGTPDGELDYLNKRALEYLDHTVESLAGGRWADLVDPDHRDATVRRWLDSATTGLSYDDTYRLRRADGQYRWIHSVGEPFYDGQGQIVRWYGLIIDIDDQKRAEAALGALKDQLYKENLVLRDEVDRTSMFEEIVGTSPALRPVLARVAKVAPTDSTVLITGETGTGKELVARAIHRRSARASRAFVSVNCAAVPRDLIASELFGHEKGAFTGATQRRLGRFELAHGGTIFLDEVGDLPMETQVALLRVLQEREFVRVGGSASVRVDVRVVAATNRDLQATIEAGTFRSDLLYRLHVFPIAVPPLRERADDIPLLVEYFIERYARKAGKTIRRVDMQTLNHLKAYPWPGNVRELQNVIERSVIVCDTDTFMIDESWLSAAPEAENRALPRTLARHERTIIEDALRASSGRVYGPSGAAARLGIARSTLESKIRGLGIDKNRFRSRRT